MYSGMKICVVIPAYNAEGTLFRFSSLPEWIDQIIE